MPDNDITPPQAPSELTCEIVDKLPKGRTQVRVGWMDNCTFDDEHNTVFQFTNADGSPNTSQGAYAKDQGDIPGYDPTGVTTGVREALLVIATPKQSFTVKAKTNRFLKIETTPGDWNSFSVDSEWSETITVEVGHGNPHS